MFETTTEQNLWLGRLVWTIIAASFVVWTMWCLRMVRRDRAAGTGAITGTLVAVVSFVVVGGGGGMAEGALLGLLLGGVAGHLVMRVSRRTGA